MNVTIDILGHKVSLEEAREIYEELKKIFEHSKSGDALSIPYYNPNLWTSELSQDTTCACDYSKKTPRDYRP